MTESQERQSNRLLQALPPSERERLKASLSTEHFELKDRLVDVGERMDNVYFPQSGVVSILTTMDDGGGVEIATVGNEGMVGVPLLLGANFLPAREFAQVQVPGELLRMGADPFQAEIEAAGPFRDVIQRYAQAFFSQVSQQVACNGLHSIEERCSRWMLLTHDRVGADEFPLTQEFLAQMLGVRRASVTLAAGMLQSAGFIRYQRGRMTIIDREGLEATSCECYGVVRAEFDRLFG